MNWNRKSLALWVLAASFSGNAQYGAESPVHWSAEPLKKAVSAGERFEIGIKARIDGAWHLYSATQPPGGPNATRFTVLPDAPFELAGQPRQSAPKVEFDPNFGINTEIFAGTADFWVPVKAALNAQPGDYELRIQVVYQVCDEQVCLPPKRVPIPVKVQLAAAVPSAAPTAPQIRADSRPQQPPADIPSASEPKPTAPAQAAPAAVPAAAPISAAPIPQPQLASGRPVVGTAADLAEARSSGFLRTSPGAAAWTTEKAESDPFDRIPAAKRAGASSRMRARTSESLLHARTSTPAT